MPEALPDPFRIEVPSHLAFVRPVRKMIEAVLTGQGWEEDDVDDVALVVTEVIQNAIEHGSRSDGSETVSIECGLTAGVFEMHVEDPGTGKDPQIVLDRDVAAPVPLDAPRGRGLFLIGRLCQGLERKLLESGGLCITVRRELETS